MIIRRANELDILKVSRLWLKMVAEMNPENTPNLLWWRNRIQALMCTPAYFMHVAEEGGGLVGMLDYLISPEPADSKLHVIGEHFYVLPEYRGKNVGGKLWAVAMRHLKKEGANILDTICCTKQREFWERRGFKANYNFMSRGVSPCRQS